MEDEANISSTQAEDSTKVFWGVSPFGGKANGSIQSPLSRKRMISGSNIQNSKDESPVNPKVCGKKYKNKLSLRMEEGEENGLLVRT